MKKSVKEISLLGVLAALYVALCIVFAPISFAALQFRVAEILIVLPFYNKKYSISIILGTFAANFFFGYGIIDAVIGSAASALVCAVIILAKNKFVIAPAAGIINGVMIGAMLYIFIIDEPPAIIILMASVAVSCFAVALAGVLAFTGIEKTNPRFIGMIKNGQNIF